MASIRLDVAGNLDDLSGRAVADYARTLEDLGIECLNTPESWRREPFNTTAQILAATTRLNAATGIASVYGRDPHAAATAAENQYADYNGRFTLGLGPTHPQMAEERGHEWIPPVKKMRPYLQALHLEFEKIPSQSNRPDIMLAANGPKLLELARELASGAYSNQMPPAHTKMAREILGPDKTFKPVMQLSLANTEREALDFAQPAFSFYAALPAYHRMWNQFGFTESDYTDGGSDALMQATGAYGNLELIIGQIHAHIDAGADGVILCPVNHQGAHLGGVQEGLKVLKALANELV